MEVAILVYKRILTYLVLVITASSYSCKLPPRAREKYLDKLKAIADFDPFLLLEKKDSHGVTHTRLPCVDASDLVSYLVLQTSYLTPKQFEAHKSLEAYIPGQLYQVVKTQANQMVY